MGIKIHSRNNKLTSEREALGFELLQDRKRDATVRLLLKILSSDIHSSLKDSLDHSKRTSLCM